MQTRCPHCQTVTELADDHPPGGMVCPTCAIPFDAMSHQVNATAEDNAAPASAKAVDQQGDLFATRARPAAAIPAVAVPRFARTRVHGPSSWRWLLVVLLAIVPIADRDELARDPDWRPRVTVICNAVGCSLPPWREPTAFSITARDFSPHPSVHGARLVTVSFRNDAQFAQAWPKLELTASDLNGRVVGQRRFGPHEYLGNAPDSPVLQPGQAASARLEIVDPNAVSWDIEFR